MIAVRDTTWRKVKRRAEAGATLLVRRIEALGLRVTLHKTEALCFKGPRWRVPAGATLRINRDEVEVRARIKYLGLILPNLRGPGVQVRRLYAMVVRSMALYGAPIWAEALDASNRALLRRPQRIVAVCACMAYRTVGHAAACALAGTPPWEIEAGVLAEAYRERAEQRARGEAPAPEELARSRAERKRTTIELWAAGLADAKYGARTIEAIRPRLSDWCGWRHGAMNYRLSQILTGHGCFGRYLHRIRREETASCHECGADEDTAQHTLQVCTAWSEERRTLAATIGDDLSLPGVIRAMLGSEGSWEAVSKITISQKEEREREREDNPLAGFPCIAGCRFEVDSKVAQTELTRSPHCGYLYRPSRVRDQFPKGANVIDRFGRFRKDDSFLTLARRRFSRYFQFYNFTTVPLTPSSVE
ncbi:uncharacterized protein LOC106713129 [Papilio machaon]|uniref:uncharacterized protein LOC106713129 n=1 Tax=Papilio machaon TaxID=76193 RepID=UPI001E6643A4|nr:uncharacterized protein LOC106713129 [Papilio machaon]